MMVGNVNTTFYSVDTNGCSSNASCKQAKDKIKKKIEKPYLTSLIM